MSQHTICNFLYFSGSQLTLNTSTTHWPGPLHAFKHSNSCQHATASGKEEIGYYAKPFLSSCGIQTHNYYHIMPFFEKTLGRMHQKLVHESCFLTKCWCLLMFLWGTYFNLWLHRMSPLEGPGWIGKQSAEGEERRRGGSKGKLRGGGGRMEKRRETVEIISNVKVTKART